MKRLFERHPCLSVCLTMLVCLGPVLVLRDFTPANELRYLSIADEALAEGHGFAFYNHGEPYADKPPLYFWLLMGCRVLLGGHSRFVLSLLSLLTAFGIVALMDRWAFRPLPPLTRAAAAGLLLTTGLFTGMAVYVRMDLLMILFIVLSLYSFWEVKPGLFGLFTFLALFTKGPVGLLLPPLSAAVFLLAGGGRYRDRAKAFGWPFWAVLGGLSLLWLGAAWMEGGTEYLRDLTVHQTVGRAVRSFHHREPFWYYLAVIWGVAAPWCVLTLPSLARSFARGGGARSDLERLFLSAVLTGLVLLSLFSSKLAIYLLPLLPFLTGVFVLLEQRRGWEGWMRICLGVVAAVFVGLGLAVLAGWAAFDHLPVPAEYGFVRTPLLFPAAILLTVAGIYALAASNRGWQRPVLALGAAILLSALVLSPLLPRVNERIGYRQLCEDIRSVARPASEICTIGLYRPENMDVYLHREIRILDDTPDGPAVDLSSLPEDAVVVVSRKKDAAASYRYSDVLISTGRTCTESSGGLYRIWH